MAIEIERKFLLKNDEWRDEVSLSKQMLQAYLTAAADSDSEKIKSSVRIRICDQQAWLNIKAAVKGVSRSEFEYEIPLEDAQAMRELCVGLSVEKTRHYIIHDGLTWEIDEFSGANQGLIVAEVELESADQDFVKPSWLGAEVSDQQKYYNAALAKRPFAQWSNRER